MTNTQLTSQNSCTLPSFGLDQCQLPRRSVNIRGVPEQVWCKARQNALASGMAFKQYVIRLLAESRPFPMDHQSGLPT
jgi:hypothetical protein